MSACAFCGAIYTASEMSPEDVIPKWFSKYDTWVRKRKGVIKQKAQLHDGSIQILDSQRHNVIANVVCTPCNTGWMSGLEAALKEMLMTPTPPTALTDVERLTFAAWMTMKAIVLDHKVVTEQGRKPFFTPKKRIDFMDTLIPPDRTSIWVARLRKGDKAGSTVIVGYLDSAERHLRHLCGYLVALHLDTLAFQFLSVKDKAKPPPGSATTFPLRTFPRFGTWDDYASRVWPLKGSVRWPPRFTLASQSDQTGFELLANRFSGPKRS